MRSIGVVTGSRADYGLYVPILHAINRSPDLSLKLFVCGMHLSERHGMTVQEIEADKFEITERLETLVDGDFPEDIAKSIGLGVRRFGEAYSRLELDFLLVLGDRFEMFSSTAAATPFAIPIAHIHGGESTEGAIDESYRHSITKMSHLHFASTQEYANRIIQMGEAPDRVFVTGAPSLDNLAKIQYFTREELQADLGLNLNQPPLLITFHPETLDFENTDTHINNLLLALNEIDCPIIITYPNADTYGRVIISAVNTFSEERSNVQIVKNLGTKRYFSLMAIAAAMVGNSSSGIIEAASFNLPVVNIGNRQRGRVRCENVIDVECRHDDIRAAIERALDPNFRSDFGNIKNPYDAGGAADKIVKILAETKIGNKILRKSFYDLTAT